MGYQALVFSADEKSSRVVSQILRELEFHVEVLAEPFAAVKQITNQHYDALVVDCDDEPNATLLFKSARNSNSNSASLAVALVQGQGGIAKAFRIGANLVLTKPIHAEQSKGTLRTAKGLLRKAEAAKSAAPAATPTFDGAPFQIAPPPLGAHAEFSASPVASAALELQEEPYPELGPADAALLESMPEPMPVKSPAAESAPPTNSLQSAAKVPAERMAIQTLGGAASAPALAKTEVPRTGASPENTSSAERRKLQSVPDKKSGNKSPSTRRESFANSPAEEDENPIFGQTLGGEVHPPETGNRRNLWIAAVLVLASAGAINYGWPQFQPLLNSLPVVGKYFAPPQAPHPSIVPTPTSAATLPATSTQVQSPAGNGSDAQPPASPEKPAADTASSAQNPLHLAPEVAAGLLLAKVEPIYPPSARQQHIEGSVQLQAEIGTDGTTSNVKILSGKTLLATAAAAAVRQWKYKPYEVNGQPTGVQTEINVDFKLP